jgi:tetratricopeptide (TPR) repeat protein
LIIAVWALATLALLAACNAQSRQHSYLQHGIGYFNAGSYDKARVEFRNAAQIDPKDANARYWLGRTQERAGDLLDAGAQYQSALINDPSLVAARAALARLYLYSGQAERVLELVEPGLVAAPSDAGLLTVRSAAEELLNRQDEALRDAEAAVRTAPTDDYAVAVLASIYKRRGQIDRAVALVEGTLHDVPANVELHSILADLYEAEQRPTQAEAEIGKIVALEPKSLAARYRLAQTDLVHGKLDAAERVLRDAVAAAPTDPEPKLQLVAFLDAHRGRERAASEIEALIAREPRNDALKVSLAQYLAKAGLTDKAEALFRAVIARAGLRAAGLSARDGLAVLLAERSNAADAQALIKEVLKENPKDDQALMLRANLAMASGNSGTAIADLRAVLRDEPNSVPLMCLLARAYERNGDGDLAQETLRNAQSLTPSDPAIRLQLARALLDAAQVAPALTLLQTLARERPLDLTVAESLYQAQLRDRRYDDARATAIAVQDARPDLALGFYLAGIIDESMGKADQAQRGYERALALEPAASEPLTALLRMDVARKQPQRGLQRVAAAIAARPGSAVPYKLKADLLLGTGDEAGAVTAYRSAIALAPAWPPPYQGLADAQAASGRLDDAILTLRAGIDKAAAGDGVDALTTQLGLLFQSAGRPDDAVALYQGVLAKNPGATFALNNLAMLLVTYKSDADSLARAQRLANQLGASSLVDVIDTRGWVKYKSGDFTGALLLLKQAVQKAPESAELRYHLGMAQLRSGDVQSAQQNLEIATRAGKPFAGLTEARSELARLRRVTAAG